METRDRNPRRRDVLRAGVLGAVGIGAAPLGALAKPGGPKPEPLVKRYRTLGKTGLKISDVSYGTGATTKPLLPLYAYYRGINYFDCAESYPLTNHGAAEKALGAGLVAKIPRDKFVLVSKTKCWPGDRKAELMKRLEKSLRNLRTDHVDIYLNHAVNGVDRLSNPEWYEFIDRAKEQGKLRFSGMSGHGGNLLECLDHGIEKDLFDVVLVAYNFTQEPAWYRQLFKNGDRITVNKGLPERLERLHAKGVGVVVMKTLMGAESADLSPFRKQATPTQAAFRWVLSNPNVDALITTMRTPKQLDDALGASGTAPRPGDVALLEEHLRTAGDTYCRQACNVCESSCPHDVPISEVLRTRMYASHYRDVAMAGANYAALARGAEACLGCAEQTCAGKCPYGLDIPALTRSTPKLVGCG